MARLSRRYWVLHRWLCCHPADEIEITYGQTILDRLREGDYLKFDGKWVRVAACHATGIKVVDGYFVEEDKLKFKKVLHKRPVESPLGVVTFFISMILLVVTLLQFCHRS